MKKSVVGGFDELLQEVQLKGKGEKGPLRLPKKIIKSPLGLVSAPGDNIKPENDFREPKPKEAIDKIVEGETIGSLRERHPGQNFYAGWLRMEEQDEDYLVVYNGKQAMPVLQCCNMPDTAYHQSEEKGRKWDQHRCRAFGKQVVERLHVTKNHIVQTMVNQRVSSLPGFCNLGELLTHGDFLVLYEEKYGEGQQDANIVFSGSSQK